MQANRTTNLYILISFNSNHTNLWLDDEYQNQSYIISHLDIIFGIALWTNRVVPIRLTLKIRTIDYIVKVILILHSTRFALTSVQFFKTNINRSVGWQIRKHRRINFEIFSIRRQPTTILIYWFLIKQNYGTIIVLCYEHNQKSG